MRILITNNSLADRAGTELYVRDIAFRLRELGHEPVCFSMRCGEVARELREGGVEVVSSLARKHGPFDVIHGHHQIETTLAAMAFPEVPVISYCHGPKAWPESPAFLPNVVHYVAVDEACRARFLEEGVSADKITLQLNFADTRRFLPRRPLPLTPRTALVLSNRATESTHLPVIREACEACGISVDVAGQDSGRLTDRPEDLLPDYDIVFAKARAAIEAMAVGCAVIQCDYFGAGWLVTGERFDVLRPLNFGYRSMSEPLTLDHLITQIRAYSAEEAAAVSERIRKEASLDAAMPGILELYERAIATPVPQFDPWEAGAGFLNDLVTHTKDACNRIPVLARRLQEHKGALDDLKSAQETQKSEFDQKRGALEEENKNLVAKIAILKKTLEQELRPWWKKWLSP